ncbi:hypothetical protein [Streptomyces sp. NPDC086787]|uniref:hypothetical protein n=1 Tax=Streptomyces sp. NPDC086787 TaxID=3365759 RepID=UPI0037F8AA37
MPQEPVGRAPARGPALVLLLGVVLTLLAHLVACAAHALEEHRPTTTTAVTAVTVTAAQGDPSGQEPDEDDDQLCCDPSHVLAYLRAPLASLLLALLLVLHLCHLRDRRRAGRTVVGGAPPGRAGTRDRPARTGPALLRAVGVSRT